MVWEGHAHVAMIAEEIIAEIRSRADIVAVIGQHVQLKKAGRSWKGLCPFHGEKTASFNVMPDKGFFHCFGCQKNGDVFTFVMEVEGKSFVEAAEQLGARFGVDVPKIEESPELRRARGERVAMLDLNKLATAFFREVLADPKRGEAGRAYLAKRGVDDATAAAFQLGYAPPEWSGLADYLKARRADMELATRLGLVAPRKSAGGYYDRFRDRLVCPVVVPGGDVVAFSARVIGTPPPAEDGSTPPKYINSPESLVYKKSRQLFGLAQAREGLQKFSRAVLVEGNFDVITLHQAGFTEVVAPLGTALTLDQVQTLKRLAPRIVLLYDGDSAGYKATIHALQTCVEADVEVKVAKRPGNARSGGSGMLADGADPDSLVASGGATQLRESIDRAIGGIEFFCVEVWGKARRNAAARTRALEDAARLAARITNPITRRMVVDTFAAALDMDVDVVRAAFQRSGAQAPRTHDVEPGRPMPPSPTNSPPPAETFPDYAVELLSLLADHLALIGSPEADKAFWLLTGETLRAMYSRALRGEPFLGLVTELLPTPVAKQVLSGKYSDHKDPHGQLAAMVGGLEHREKQLERARLRASFAQAKLTASSSELVRLEAQLAQARGREDRELITQLEAAISSYRKQAE